MLFCVNYTDTLFWVNVKKDQTFSTMKSSKSMQRSLRPCLWSSTIFINLRHWWNNLTMTKFFQLTELKKPYEYWKSANYFTDRPQILVLIWSKFKEIKNFYPTTPISPEKLWFFEDFRERRNWLICLNSLNIRKVIYRRYLKFKNYMITNLVPEQF